jgi:hypothetical protein
MGDAGLVGDVAADTWAAAARPRPRIRPGGQTARESIGPGDRLRGELDVRIWRP